MRRIVTYDVQTQYNLGGPSILLGFYALLQEIYGDGFEMINFQRAPILPLAVSDFPFQALSIRPYRAADVFKTLRGWRQPAVSGDGVSLSDAFEMVRKADAVIDLYGICFCDKLGSSTLPASLAPLSATARFPLSAAAKKHRVLSLKNTASYGPIQTEFSRRTARFAARHLFDRMSAREEQSLQAMLALGRFRNILSAPDIANLMPCPGKTRFARPTVGISTSHQIIRQWTSAEDYVQCVAKLCLHIQRTYDTDVLLIPNEFSPNTDYNDVDVCEDILALLREQGGDARILDVRSMNSSQIKDAIAACGLLVASRYHACVAALSTGVPLMVVGWHYKYEELLRWYGQTEWLLSESDCDSEKLITMFDRLWRERDRAREEIAARYPAVREAVIQTGRKMLGAD